MIWVAVKERHFPIRMRPCMVSCTDRLSGVPAVIAWISQRRAASGRSPMVERSKTPGSGVASAKTIPILTHRARGPWGQCHRRHACTRRWRCADTATAVSTKRVDDQPRRSGGRRHRQRRLTTWAVSGAKDSANGILELNHFDSS